MFCFWHPNWVSSVSFIVLFPSIIFTFWFLSYVLGTMLRYHWMCLLGLSVLTFLEHKCLRNWESTSLYWIKQDVFLWVIIFLRDHLCIQFSCVMCLLCIIFPYISSVKLWSHFSSISTSVSIFTNLFEKSFIFSFALHPSVKKLLIINNTFQWNLNIISYKLLMTEG